MLPDDSDLPFFPSGNDFDLSGPETFTTLSVSVSEDQNVLDYSPALAPASSSAGSRSSNIPEDSKSKPGSSTNSTARVEKRKANTLAARRYRQKRLDQVSELEAALKQARCERDAFKNQVLRLQGETELLKDLLRQKS